MADIEAALGALGDAGLRLIDEEPRDGIRGSRVAFLHPACTGGVLTEIVAAATEGTEWRRQPQRMSIGFLGGQVLHRAGSAPRS